MFFSSHEGGLDQKGRVSIPASFRAALGGANKVYLMPALDKSGCLEGGGEELLQYYRAIFARMAPGNPKRASFRAAVFSNIVELGFDSTGRIVLPKSLIEAAGLTDRVLFAGHDDRFQVWDPDRFAAYADKARDEAAENLSDLDEPFFEALQAGDIRTGGRP